MKLNDDQLKYLHTMWDVPVEHMHNLDAYRGWTDIGYCETCSNIVDTVILWDSDGHVQYSFLTDGRMPGEDSLPYLPD